MPFVPEINDGDVVAEVAVICAAYERALVANDVEALKGFFWQSPLTLRFGASEELYGAEQIAAFRTNRKIDFSGRKVLRQDVLALGRDVAVATLEVSVSVAGKPKHGRQSQVWVRFEGIGWQIVSAHVSHRVEPAAVASPEASLGASAAAVLGIDIDPAFRDGVWSNLATMALIAAPLMAVELPADLEPAPVFRP
jgi:hypothetical protein